MKESDGNTIRVLTVDDHELIRRGIRFSLIPVEDVELIGEARDGQEALDLCFSLRPDVVLMDMRLSDDTDGIDITRDIRSQCPQTQVIILSTFHDKELVQGAMKAGAIGYLIKGVSGEELTSAIRNAHAGKPVLGVEALEDLVDSSHTNVPTDFQLTPREEEVLAMLANGLSNPDIAAQLHLSVAAIKYHVSNIFSKLAVSNRTEAATFALEHNIVPKR